MQSVHVFIFCNPTSGGNKAAKLLDLPIKKTSFAFEDKDLSLNMQVRIYNLKNDETRLEGFDVLKTFKDSKSTIRAVAAGGDGTVKWVISELERIGCVLEIPIGVIPFGTGNDMARILGWGATAPSPLIGGDDMRAFKQIIKDLVMGEPLSLDVWKVETKVDPEKGRFEVAVKGEIVERKDKAKVVVDHMINYCSFGQDARAVFGFERHRKTSQFRNKVQFALEGAKLTFQRGRKLAGASLTLDGQDITDIHQQHGVIFQNIPSYAGGSDFWDAAEIWSPGEPKAPQLVGDGLLEAHGLGKVIDIGLHKATLGIRDATTKISHASKIFMKFDKESGMPTYFQVDGEPCKLICAESCEITQAFQVKMISRNDAKSVLIKSLDKSEGATALTNLMMSGFLLKSRRHSAKDSWNSRYVALVQRENGRLLNLEWYRGGQLRGRICIIREGVMEATVERLDHGGPRPNTCFSVKTKKKSVHFAAKNEEEREQWVLTLGLGGPKEVKLSIA
jgi:diacylglycerol kinase family enzyme